jgi:hypothetical protein
MEVKMKIYLNKKQKEYLDELLERERNLENFKTNFRGHNDLKLVESIIIKINGGLK